MPCALQRWGRRRLDRVTHPSFDERIAAREARIGIVGLGYAGLPLAIAFADAGFAVTGIDRDPERVAAVNAGRSYLVDVPEELYAVKGSLRATSDYAAIAELDALTICVPTPLSKSRTPDLGYVISAAESVAAHARSGQVVILQSTTYPGTTEEVVVPILERAGLRTGTDVHVGYAPERVDPGNEVWRLHNTPKLVAGITPECARRTATLYETVVEKVIRVSSTAVAETAKLHENTFRAVNIALANELALMCDHMGVDVWEVIAAASSKPFAFMPHYPGPGLGGDCIPVVPHFLSWRLREYGFSTRLIDVAHEVNASMPMHVIQLISDALNEGARSVRGARVLLLGVAYKPDVHDTRESPSLEILRQLRHRGAEVSYCDPFVPVVELEGRRDVSLTWGPEAVADADLVVVLTAHRVFLTEPHWQAAKLLVDTRNAVPPGPNVRRL